MSYEKHDSTFACNGCGVCCKGRLIPLTLEESRRWLQRGHDVAVILEAFDKSYWQTEPEKRAHNIGRSARVDSSGVKINIIAIFAANALDQCPNLDDQERCGIYHERPLVCRIYPMEISPFIVLDPLNKVCLPETLEAGDVIVSDSGVATGLADQIEQSKTADRLDARAKVSICESMNMTVAAWKEDAFAVYLPERNELMDAISRNDEGLEPGRAVSWSVRTSSQARRESLAQSGVLLDNSVSSDYIFHEL